MTLQVLSVDNHLLFVLKPAGVPVVPDASGDASLLEQAKTWVAAEFGKPGAVFLGVVHRLDRPVSGVVLFARTSKAAARLSTQFRERRVRKLYLAVAEGGPRADEGQLVQWLVKDEDTNRVSAVEGPRSGAREARTRWRVLERRGERTLLELEPLSGRAHQLRVAAAALGCPLLGDLKYGARSALPDRSVALHARALALEHPTLRTPIEVLADPPPTDVWRGWGS
jgi:23S rRNA pseudouridine1911/1915/1917 synthase